MRAHRFIAAIAIVAAFAQSAFTTEDHLLPGDVRDNGAPGYWKLVHRRLLVTAADCGRLVIMPSAASLGEECVSVYSKRSKFYVTYTKATRQLWYQRMYAGKLPNDPYASPKPIRVVRVDAPLPASAALAVRGAWTQSLRRAGPRKGPATVEDVVFDATEYQFSIVSGTKTLIGTSYSPSTNNVSELAKIGQLLIDYCKADQSQRSTIAADVDTRAKRLESKLAMRNHGRPNQAMQPTASPAYGFPFS